VLLVGSLRQLFPRRRETPASEAFEDVFREHFDPVWRTSYALVGPDIADDVTQEVFLIVQRKLPLSRLPMPQREAFVLKEIEGFTAPEIAAAVGSPVQTIYARLRAAKSELQRFRAELRAGGDGR
jgi:RNA polymerase sigma-70 factor (ECF subfamily)